MFSSVTFWCEFPDRVDWKNLKFPFPARVYVAVSSLEEFKKIRRLTPKNVHLGARPVLKKVEGYWFSGFCSEECILRLKEFEGVDVKIDVEPPLPSGRFGAFPLLTYGVNVLFFKKAKNNFLLKTTLDSFSSSSLIISGLPLPEFLLKRYGDDFRKDLGMRNFFIYKTFFSGFLGDVLNVYYRWFVKSRLKMYKGRAMFAIGCLGPGIFGNEPVYKDLNSFEKDLRWFSSLGVKNLVVFNLEGVMMRENKEERFAVLKKSVDNKAY